MLKSSFYEIASDLGAQFKSSGNCLQDIKLDLGTLWSR